MKINLDKFEMYYLLESCLRGSHLRSSTILRFVDEWYYLFTEKERNKLYEDVLRIIYNNHFEPDSRCCGADIIFMAAYNPNNRYLVTTYYDGVKDKVEAFFMDGKYYITSNRFIDSEYITTIEKINNDKYGK